MLNQRLMDMKKTLQHELKSSSTEKIIIATTGSGNSATTTTSTTTNNSNRTKPNGYHTTDNNAPLNAHEIDQNNQTNFAMDDVNFKYLKHVILKFLTSREVKTRHFVCNSFSDHSLFISILV